MSLSKSFLTILVKKMQKDVLNARLSKILFYNHSDFFMTCNNEQKLFISLNNTRPFLSVCHINTSFTSLITPFSLSMKNELLDMRIEKMELVNNDRIVCLFLKGTDDAYHTIQRRLYLELFANHPNAILTDENDKIIIAYKSSDLLSKRIIRRDMHYTFPETTFCQNAESAFSRVEIEALYRHHDLTGESVAEIIKQVYEDEQIYQTQNYFSIIPLPHIGKSIAIDIDALVLSYLETARLKRLETKYAFLLDYVGNKIRSLEKLKMNYEEDLKIARSHLIYREYGDALLTYQYAITLNLGPATVNVNGLLIDVDNRLSIATNATNYYKKYRKAKAAIAHLEQLKTALDDDLSYFHLLREQITNGSENDLDEIGIELGLSKTKKASRQKASKVKSISPYFIIYEHVKIGFGRNNLQNDELTHKWATNKDWFLHAANHPGSHIIIFDEKPTDKVVTLAAELALYLAHLEDGDVTITQKKNIKKLTRPGLVSLQKYRTVHMKKVRNLASILEEAKRL